MYNILNSMLYKLKLQKRIKVDIHIKQGGSGRAGRVGYPQKRFNPSLPVLKAGLSGPPQPCASPKPN